MKKIIGIVLSLLAFYAPVLAQYEVAAYNYAQNYFNNGQALPAESNLLLTGEAPEQVSRIEVSVFKAKANHNRPPLYHATWIRPDGQQENGYTLPLNYKLHGNSDYDIVFAYFKAVSSTQKSELRELLTSTTQRMIRQSVQQRDKVSFQGTEKRLIRDMEDFTSRALAAYRTPEAGEFGGFSEATSRVMDALFNLPSDADNSSIEMAISAAEKQVAAEVGLFLQQPLAVRSDQRTVRDYPTEKVAGSIAVNVGYGGVYLDGKIDNLTYGEGAYIGLSLPLGSRTFSGRFLSNTSISVGAFLQNFEDDQGGIYTGPIFKRPYFVGLGYSLFRFVRLNAGAVALEQRTSNGTGIDVGAVQLQPFVGISAELNLSISLGQKRN
ncbi:MAG: hypothetical protein AB8F95_00475 [Bacteroidia bacterium]